MPLRTVARVQGVVFTLLPGPGYSLVYRRIVPRATGDPRARRVDDCRVRIGGAGRRCESNCADSTEHGNTSYGGRSFHHDHFGPIRVLLMENKVEFLADQASAPLGYRGKGLRYLGMGSFVS